MKPQEIEKINKAFEQAEANGLLRFRVEPDETVYDDSYVDTWEVSESEKDAAKKEIWKRIEQDGVWGIVVDKKCSACSQWETVDSVWGFIGSDFSGYDVDVKESGLNAIK